VKHREVGDFLVKIAPPESGAKGDPIGFLYGDPEGVCTGVACVWTPSLAVLRKAVERGLNLIETHEIPFFTGGKAFWYDVLPEERKRPNILRKQILDQHRMCIFRTHTVWDVYPVKGQIDSFGRALGLTKEIARSRGVRVYEIAPITLAALADKVAAVLGLEVIRVVGDMKRIVRRVATLVGGMGQLSAAPEGALNLGADVAILGEMIDYTARYAVDAGLALIETAHMTSENPGVQGVAEVLRERFPGLRVEFLDAGIPWRFVTTMHRR
jgi:putative NIF3 family GTP cyclohydrolase 1 type 2